jgi:hypothetical protein
LPSNASSFSSTSILVCTFGIDAATAADDVAAVDGVVISIIIPFVPDDVDVDDNVDDDAVAAELVVVDDDAVGVGAAAAAARGDADDGADIDFRGS